MDNLSAEGLHSLQAAKCVLTFKPASGSATGIRQQNKKCCSVRDGFVTGNGNNSTQWCVGSLQYSFQKEASWEESIECIGIAF